MVRDYIKWDDTPVSLQHFAESAVRAYKVSMTPWQGPVVVVADSELQERPIEPHAKLRIPRLTLASLRRRIRRGRRSGEDAGGGRQPGVRGRSGGPDAAGMTRLVELAELLQASVVSTQPNTAPPITAGRLNFPNRHPLNQTLRSVAAIGEADLVVGLEVANFFGTVNLYRDQLERSSRSATRAGTKLVTITAGEFSSKSNYQDFSDTPRSISRLRATPKRHSRRSSKRSSVS
jgi:thiamine pyrophosphate-dependent acetolactate synthase large subunit-like protein